MVNLKGVDIFISKRCVYLFEGRLLQAVCHQNADYIDRSAE